MKYTLIAFMIILFIFIKNSYSQATSKFWFGVEAGTNQIDWYQNNETSISAQVGFVTEYEILTDKLSILGRLKLYKTGISFFQDEVKSNSNFFNFFGDSNFSPKYSGWYEGTVMAFPLNLKYNFWQRNNHQCFAYIGATYVYELNYTYQYYSENLDPNNYPHQFFSFNYGLGYAYTVNDFVKLYTSVDEFYGGKKGQVDDEGIFLNNIHINLGILFRKKPSKTRL